jgi:3-carboxy-cis,cis-muconate cycloisomerase
MTGRGLLDPLFTTRAVAEAVSDRAWLQAMLDVEAALATAQARLGIIPPAAAEAITEACDADRFDLDALARASAAAGVPVVPLVRALERAVPEAAASYVHKGATSQDILDSAAMLVAARALAPILDDLDRVASACARLAADHRDTVMAGRTLLQQAVPTTFGLKAAGWLVGVDDARARLAEVRDSRLAAQFGGAAGTLASLDEHGVAVMEALADELGLARPPLPWHTNRVRVAELAAALGTVTGILGKIAADVLLLAQTEVAEVAEPQGPGRGASSAMPHKRNPVGSVLAAACASRAPGLVATLLASMAHEHERAAGAWHAEWESLTDLLRVTGGAAGHVREVLDGLRVDAARMRANLDATAGLLLAEGVTGLLAGPLGRPAARAVVEEACRAAVESGRPLRDVLLDDERVSARLGPDEIDAALDPAAATGAAGQLIERALARHHRAGGPANA